MKPVSDQEENELLIFHLRHLCEAKQKTHIHVDEAPMECSSGDSPPSTPPASPVALAGHPFPEEDSDSPQFRRRAHTFSHPPSASKKRITFQDGRSQSVRSPLLRQNSAEQSRLAVARRTRSESESSVPPSLPPSFSAPSFLKSLYQSSGKPSSPPEGDPPRSDVEKRKRTSSVCSSDSLNAGGLTLAPRRISWRQRIFLRVASPMKKSPSAMQLQDGCDEKELLPLSPHPPSFDEVPLVSILQNEDVQDQTGEKKNSVELQSLWRKAIHQQILLLRMEKENQKLEASRDELQSRKVKLDYEEVGTCQKDVINIWDKKLLNCRAKIRCVPKSRRGEIWQFLAVQHRVRHRLPNKQQPPDISYQDLLKQLTAQQHAILVDLGRTFPTHPYFSAQLGAGQLSLFNLLKAYSLLDKEVGYCQGISFVAGVLLLHMSEEQAFEMLKFLMYDLGFRKQYRPDMMSLEIQMYQLSRLLHDYHRDLYHHLEENEISPSLYAAPWFLTLFASQFPLGFVARIFVKSVVFEMDISKQLHAYEVEYHVLQDELQDNLSPCEEIEASEKLERANSQLKRQNMDLLEKLQVKINCRARLSLNLGAADNIKLDKVAHAKIQGVESNLEAALRRESQMMILIQSLEEEKALYQKTLEKICSYLPQEALSDCEELLKKVNCHPNKF
ncbi:hypothetical protein Chor_000799 [Crotalus horridus]